mgnify:CR=1 FL=1
MQSSTPLVKANVLSEIRNYLQKRSVALDPLLDEVGLSANQIADPNTDLPLDAVMSLFHTASVRASDPCFGLHYAETFPRGGTGLLGQLLLTAPTVRDFVKALAQYIRVHVQSSVEFVEAGGIGRLSWSLDPDLRSPRLQYTAFMIALFVLRLREGSGAEWRPLTINLQDRAPAEVAEYVRILQSRVHFEQRNYEILLDATTLARRLPQPIANLFETVKKVGDSELAQIERSRDIVVAVRRAIADRFGTEESFDLEAIAAHVGVPPRSLQWRLDQRETSYEKILSDVRREVAEGLLRDTDMAMTEIAARIRFSELSAFTRAAQRWFQMAPSAYRRKLRGANPTSGQTES